MNCQKKLNKLSRYYAFGELVSMSECQLQGTAQYFQSVRLLAVSFSQQPNDLDTGVKTTTVKVSLVDLRVYFDLFPVIEL